MANRGESVRLDLWAWAVRLFKTRSDAAAACKKERILVKGQRCRAAKQVRVGDEIRVADESFDETLDTLKVLRRIPAAASVDHGVRVIITENHRN